MKIIYSSLIALLIALVGLSKNNDMVSLAAICTAVIVSGLVVFLILKMEATDSGYTGAFIFSGVAVGLFAVNQIIPLMSGLPAYSPWVLLIIFAPLGGILFHSAASAMRNTKISTSHAVEIATVPAEKIESEKTPKILDTSIVIDGRVIELASTGFLEPPFVVPHFVLREIQLISDSPDPIKRNRGRRGLDMLNQLQKRTDLEVKISYKDYTETREVDQKLVKLARETGGYLVTNDFNLNKVAELQGIKVLNINNLANALKPVVLPGEELELQVVKEGKDENQGIGYLDDGTMVVIESGGKLVGKKVKVNVTSVIQTNAGKMVFTKIMQK